MKGPAQRGDERQELGRTHVVMDVCTCVCVSVWESHDSSHRWLAAVSGCDTGWGPSHVVMWSLHNGSQGSVCSSVCICAFVTLLVLNQAAASRFQASKPLWHDISRFPQRLQWAGKESSTPCVSPCISVYTDTDAQLKTDATLSEASQPLQNKVAIQLQNCERILLWNRCHNTCNNKTLYLNAVQLVTFFRVEFHLVWHSLPSELTGTWAASRLFALIRRELWLVSLETCVLTKVFLAKLAAFKRDCYYAKMYKKYSYNHMSHMICLKQNDYIASAVRDALLFASAMLKGQLTSKWNL